jgi:hypothetical protein
VFASKHESPLTLNYSAGNHTTTGTSTGGIIAALCGLECYPIVQCEAMYDALIKDIFQRHPTGGVKLALKQAFYDEENWMSILKGIVSI